jgi:hypothetical protein
MKGSLTSFDPRIDVSYKQRTSVMVFRFTLERQCRSTPPPPSDDNQPGFE